MRNCAILITLLTHIFPLPHFHTYQTLISCRGSNIKQLIGPWQTSQKSWIPLDWKPCTRVNIDLHNGLAPSDNVDQDWCCYIASLGVINMFFGDMLFNCKFLFSVSIKIRIFSPNLENLCPIKDYIKHIFLLIILLFFKLHINFVGQKSHYKANFVSTHVYKRCMNCDWNG